MRFFREPQSSLDETPIAEIYLGYNYRDRGTKLLFGLKHVYCHESLRQTIRQLLLEHFQRLEAQGYGCPNLDLWKILVLACYKLRVGDDIDMLLGMANHHLLLRQFLGHGDSTSREKYERDVLIRNLNLLTPEIIVKICETVVNYEQLPTNRNSWIPPKAISPFRMIIRAIKKSGTWEGHTLPKLKPKRNRGK